MDTNNVTYQVQRQSFSASINIKGAFMKTLVFEINNQDLEAVNSDEMVFDSSEGVDENDN